MGQFEIGDFIMKCQILLISGLLFWASLVNSVPLGETTTDGWSPDPCFPHCTTDSSLTSPPPERGCVKTDCFDEPLCQDMCAVIMHCHSYEWIMNNDDNDIFGETWCAVDGTGMCYCCDCE